MGKEINCDILIQRNTTHTYFNNEGWTNFLCNKMDGSQMNYAKWKNPGSKDWLLPDSISGTFMKNQKQTSCHGLGVEEVHECKGIARWNPLECWNSSAFCFCHVCNIYDKHIRLYTKRINSCFRKFRHKFFYQWKNKS